MRGWGDEFVRWWVCEVKGWWGGGLVRGCGGEVMGLRVFELMRWWGGEVMSLWIDDFIELMYSGVVWAFMSLSASGLFCYALRTWAECLSCVGMTKTTNSFQLIETLKVKTASIWEHPSVFSKIKIYIYIFYNSTSFMILTICNMEASSVSSKYCPYTDIPYIHFLSLPIYNRISLSLHSFIAIIFSHEISIIRINSFTLEDTVSVWFCNFFYPEIF